MVQVEGAGTGGERVSTYRGLGRSPRNRADHTRPSTSEVFAVAMGDDGGWPPCSEARCATGRGAPRLSRAGLSHKGLRNSNNAEKTTVRIIIGGFWFSINAVAACQTFSGALDSRDNGWHQNVKAGG